MIFAKLLIYLAILPWCHSQAKTEISKTLSVNETVMLASPNYPVCCMEDVHYKLKCTLPACAFNITLIEADVPNNTKLKVKGLREDGSSMSLRYWTLPRDTWVIGYIIRVEGTLVDIIITYPKHINYSGHAGFKVEVTASDAGECLSPRRRNQYGVCFHDPNDPRYRSWRGLLGIPSLVWFFLPLACLYIFVCVNYYRNSKRKNKNWTKRARWHSKKNRSSSRSQLIPTNPEGTSPTNINTPTHETKVSVNYNATNKAVVVSLEAPMLTESTQLPRPPSYLQALQSRYDLHPIEEEVDTKTEV